MQNQTFHAGATNAPESIVEEQEYLEPKKTKKSTEKKHLKKRKTRVSTERRYEADDIYDPDSGNEGSTMKKYKIGKKFHSINPPPKKPAFPIPSGKALGPIKYRKQSQFIQNLNESQYIKNAPIDIRRKATQLKINEEFLTNKAPKKGLKSERQQQAKMKRQIEIEKDLIRKSLQQSIQDQEQQYIANKMLIDQENEKINMIKEQLMAGSQMVKTETKVVNQGFRGHKVKNRLEMPRKSDDLFLPSIVTQQVRNHNRMRSLD